MHALERILRFRDRVEAGVAVIEHRLAGTRAPTRKKCRSLAAAAARSRWVQPSTRSGETAIWRARMRVPL